VSSSIERIPNRINIDGNSNPFNSLKRDNEYNNGDIFDTVEKMTELQDIAMFSPLPNIGADIL
jgi:hypothetical protein